MESQTNTSVTYVYPPQPNVIMPAMPVQTQVVSVKHPTYTYGAEKSVGMGVAEIVLRVICLVSYYISS